MTGREVAWRMLAHEVLASTVEEPAIGERSAAHLLSPAGARMSRVLVAGTLAPPDRLGADPGQPFLVARLTDPTGAISVSAGNFQPRALAELGAVERAQFARVIGKVHLYRGRTGPPEPSVRAESVRAISLSEYRVSLADAADHALRRLDLLRRLRADPQLRDPTTPSIWLRAGRDALRAYPTADLEAFRRPLGTVLDYVRGPPSSTEVAGPSRVASAAVARVTRAPVPPTPGPVSASGRAEEAAFLDIIDELSDGSADGYADLREAFGLAGRRGVPETLAEELLNRLEEGGVVEEPIVGKVRRA